MDKKSIIDGYIREAHEKGAFTGAWLYAQNGNIVSEGTLGFGDTKDRLPLDEDCVFDLASVTKQFTASAVMLLRREGLLSLDDEITRFFPQIPYKGITVRHLLTHTSGLPDYMDWVGNIAKEENRIPGNDIIVRYLVESGDEPEFAPGEGWEYSNTGYCLLAEIVEKVSGVRFEDFLKSKIFEPAGMTSTRVFHRRKEGIPEKLAYGMVLDVNEGRFRLPDDTEEYRHVVTLDGVNGDGLVHSNVRDLFKWDRALREGRVLTLEEQRLMYTPGKLSNGATAGDESDEDGNAYGFGWYVEEHPTLGLIVRHSGGWPGYSSWFERFIDADRVLILLRCRDALDDRAYETFFSGIKAIARDEEPEPIKTVEDIMLKEPDRSGFNAFCGRYEFDEDSFFRVDEVFLKDSELFVRYILKGRAYTERLYPIGDRLFTLKTSEDEFLFEDNALTLWGETHRKL